MWQFFFHLQVFYELFLMHFICSKGHVSAISDVLNSFALWKKLPFLYSKHYIIPLIDALLKKDFFLLMVFGRVFQTRTRFKPDLLYFFKPDETRTRSSNPWVPEDHYLARKCPIFIAKRVQFCIKHSSKIRFATFSSLLAIYVCILTSKVK